MSNPFDPYDYRSDRLDNQFERALLDLSNEQIAVETRTWGIGVYVSRKSGQFLGQIISTPTIMGELIITVLPANETNVNVLPFPNLHYGSTPALIKTMAARAIKMLQDHDIQWITDIEIEDSQALVEPNSIELG